MSLRDELKEFRNLIAGGALTDFRCGMTLEVITLTVLDEARKNPIWRKMAKPTRKVFKRWLIDSVIKARELYLAEQTPIN